MPNYGRSYDVFYNQERLGKIQIEATTDFLSPGLRHYGESRNGEEPSHKVRTTVELKYLRLIQI
jgi:hypothetical protein